MIYLLSYAVICVLIAADNAKRIREGKRIYHGLNGALHIAAAIGAFVLYDWKLSLALLVMTRLVFDTALNLFRGLPIDYVPLAPKSIIDKLEKSVFGMNGVYPKVLYIVVIIILIVW